MKMEEGEGLLRKRQVPQKELSQTPLEEGIRMAGVKLKPQYF
jgi:hypothetical protein